MYTRIYNNKNNINKNGINTVEYIDECVYDFENFVKI